MLKKLLLTVLVVVVICGCIIFVQGVRASLEAEQTLHACITSIRALNEYAELTEGGWPSSWEEMMTKLQKVESASMYQWPEDLPEIRKRVNIDFTADPAELAQLKAQEFRAIEPIGPCYVFDDYLNHLIETLKRFHTP